VDYNLREQITNDTGMPFVFTEYGILMLATVLSSKKSVQLNIAIVKAFAELKEFL
jgi:phage regulator Rha-like protein